jgi:zinc transporter
MPGPIPPRPLVWAMHFPPDGPPVQLDAAVHSVGGPGWTWMHYDLVHAGTREALAEIATLPDEARQMLLSPDGTQRVAVEDDAVAGVLPGFERGRVEAVLPPSLTSWHFAMRPGLIVTARRAPVGLMMQCWQAACKGHAPAGPAELLDDAILHFAADVRREATRLGESLEDVEEALLDEDPGANLTTPARQLGRVRRAGAHLRRTLLAQLRLLQDDETEWPDWAVGEDRDRTVQGLMSALDDLHSLQDRSRILQDEISARQAEETNRRLYVVSIVTALAMPAALVTGFFGMNTGGLPWNGTAAGTALAGGVMVIAVIVTLGVLRWKKLL